MPESEHHPLHKIYDFNAGCPAFFGQREGFTETSPGSGYYAHPHALKLQELLSDIRFVPSRDVRGCIDDFFQERYGIDRHAITMAAHNDEVMGLEIALVGEAVRSAKIAHELQRAKAENVQLWREKSPTPPPAASPPSPPPPSAQPA